VTERANETVLWYEDVWSEQSEGLDGVLDLQGKWIKLAQDLVRWRSVHSDCADGQQQSCDGIVKLASVWTESSSTREGQRLPFVWLNTSCSGLAM